MLNKYLFLIFISTINLPLIINSSEVIQTINHKVSNESNGPGITIIFPNNQSIVLPGLLAKKFDFFKVGYDFDSQKQTANLIRLPKNIPGHVNKTTLGLIKLLDKRIEPACTKKRDRKRYIDAYQAADFLGASKRIFRLIARSFCEQNSDSPDQETILHCAELKKYLGIKDYFERMNKHIDEDDIRANRVLDLSDKGIFSLDDVEYFTKILSKKTWNNVLRINLDKNKIDSFDVAVLSKIFPKLKHLNINDNAISSLDLNNIVQMQNHFFLNISGNPIQSLTKPSIFRIPFDCTLAIDDQLYGKICSDKQFKQIITLLKAPWYHNKGKLRWLKERLGHACILSIPIEMITLTFGLVFGNYKPFVVSTVLTGFSFAMFTRICSFAYKGGNQLLVHHEKFDIDNEFNF